MKPKQPKIEVNLQYGHSRFYELTKEEEDLHSRKNRDYAKGGSPLGNFERVSTILSLYPGFPLNTKAGVALMYMLKQIDATLWSLSRNYELKTDSLKERLADVSVYAKIATICWEEDQKK